jgi:hypothetical protein
MEDVLDSPKFSSHEWTLGAYIRVLAMLNRTKSRDGILRASPRVLAVLMGRSRGDLVGKRLALGAHLGLWSAARYADYTLILVANWAERQGFAPSELRQDSVQTPRTTPTPTPTPKKEKATPPSASAMGLAGLLREELEKHVDHARKPARLEPWAKVFDLMLKGTKERGAIPHAHIERVIRWVVRDDFEKKNVQSAGKLSKRFAALFDKAKEANSTPTRPPPKPTLGPDLTKTRPEDLNEEGRRLQALQLQAEESKR